jgi:signal transduction histidine kinase
MPARILIVDDERPGVEVLEEMLAAEGYHLFTAASGDEALAFVAQQPPDLILLDVLMPEMNGFEVTSRLKGNADTKSIPVVLITAFDDRQGRLHGLRAGAEDFLTKPVDRAELCARVRNLLRLKLAIEEAESARELAEDANRAKSLFLQTIGHELRTPLSAITGYTEILELGIHGPVNSDQSTDLNRIMRATGYIQSLISDLLTMARLEHSQPLELQSVAVNAVFSEVEGLCVLQARASGVNLTLSPGTRDLFVTADAERFRQVLLNLVTNAIKFTPRDGSVRVTCGEENGLVRFRLTDTGIGISARDVDRVFEPFVQINSDRTTPSQRGVGLGLSISRQLARAMHGDLSVESAEGVGSTFTLTLPIARHGVAPYVHEGEDTASALARSNK